MLLHKMNNKKYFNSDLQINNIM